MKKLVIAVSVVVAILSAANLTFAQGHSQDPGHGANAEVAGVKFSVPKGFTAEKTSDARVAFMRHTKYDLALFVAVPTANPDDKYLMDLSNTLVSRMFPKENGFRWKVLPGEGKVSKFETSSGNTKGYNGRKFFQTDYVSLKIDNREILVGYITRMGERTNNESFLFNLEGVAGGSMPGWYAQAHVIASITGEKYEAINPGTTITGTSVTRPE